MNASPDLMENHTFDELQIGQSARLLRTLMPQDIEAFAAVSGDNNPAHLDEGYAQDTLMQGVVGHGMWSGALISALLGTQFPGTGTLYLDQSLHFARPVRIGDTLTVSATVTAKDAAHQSVDLVCEVVNQKGERVVSGVARVRSPTKKVVRERSSLPRIQLLDPQARFKYLLALGERLPAVPCAVVHPCDKGSLAGALDAAQLGLMVPILVGPETKIRSVADEAGLDLRGPDTVEVVRLVQRRQGHQPLQPGHQFRLHRCRVHQVDTAADHTVTDSAHRTAWVDLVQPGQDAVHSTAMV